MTYKRGNRVELVHTTDPHTALVPGDLGTVRRYDAGISRLSVEWDSGSTLAMLLDEGDKVRPA